jgi:hypothetical protein
MILVVSPEGVGVVMRRGTARAMPFVHSRQLRRG